jgi:hypothetical protein
MQILKPGVSMTAMALGHWKNPQHIRHGANVKPTINQVKGEKAARLLLEHGADAHALDIKNPTPLHLASENGCVGVVRFPPRAWCRSKRPRCQQSDPVTSGG